MRKLMIILGVAAFVLAACGGSNFNLSIANSPTYVTDGDSEIILNVDEDGESVTGAVISGTLEMERMDHGITTASFSDNGDGTYTAMVDLDMSGEWIMSVEIEYDGKTHTETISINVN